jgi:metal-responsive CopG/Arc/MetJ family transcriptional regulator
MMITNARIPISLSGSLVSELAAFNTSGDISEFIEKAVRYYIQALKKQERIQRDIEIINANAERFNREAEENVRYQEPL